MHAKITPTISKHWVKTHVLESVYLNDTSAIHEIAPSRIFPKRMMDRLLPHARPLSIPASKDSVSERILALLLSTKVRRGSKSMIEPYLAPIRAAIERSVRHAQPISFVLPSLPFKDQSPFTTGASMDHADLAEYSFFAQIQRVMNAIRELYAPGAHLTILCDGFVYADIFANGNAAGAGKYKAQNEQIKNTYELYNEVTLFDMREVLFDFPEWPIVHRAIHTNIQDLYASDEEIKKRIDGLARRFIYHVELPGLSYEDARKMYLKHPWPADITKRLTDSAILYCTLQLTLKKTQLVHRAFPAALRCTVHPKPAPQLPLQLTNTHNHLLPYNGVATVSRAALERGQSHFEALRIQRLCDVYRQTHVKAVHVEHERYPYYYEVD